MLPCPGTGRPLAVPRACVAAPSGRATRNTPCRLQNRLTHHQACTLAPASPGRSTSSFWCREGLGARCKGHVAKGRWQPRTPQVRCRYTARAYWLPSSRWFAQTHEPALWLAHSALRGKRAAPKAPVHRRQRLARDSASRGRKKHGRIGGLDRILSLRSLLITCEAGPPAQTRILALRDRNAAEPWRSRVCFTARLVPRASGAAASPASCARPQGGHGRGCQLARQCRQDCHPLQMQARSSSNGLRCMACQHAVGRGCGRRLSAPSVARRSRRRS